MNERTTTLLKPKGVTFPGGVDLSPQGPPLEGLPTHRAKVVVVTLLDPSPSQGADRNDLYAFFSTRGIKEYKPVSPETDQQEREKITPLEARIRQNFYLSFQFSQNDRDLQALLFAAVSPQYSSEELKNEFGTLEELNRRMSPRIAKLQVPAAHREIPNPKKEFEAMWAVQLETLKAHFDNEYQSPSDSLVGRFLHKTEEAQRIDILSRMVARDEELISQKTKNENFEEQIGRPETKIDRDLFGSQVKKYINDGNHAGSSEYEVLFDPLRKIVKKALLYDPARDAENFDLAFSTLSVKIRKLQKKWEETHPGKKFAKLVRTSPFRFMYDEEMPDVEASQNLWQELDGLSGDDGENSSGI